MDDDLASRINTLATEIFRELHTLKPFVPGQTPIPVTVKFFGAE